MESFLNSRIRPNLQGEVSNQREQSSRAQPTSESNSLNHLVNQWKKNLESYLTNYYTNNENNQDSTVRNLIPIKTLLIFSKIWDNFS